MFLRKEKNNIVIYQLDDGKTKIDVKLKDEKGKCFIVPPKTINSERKVYICDTLLSALNNYKNKQ